MSNATKRNLTLFALTWPIFIEMFLHILMGNADTLMLSRYSDNSVGAVGVANQYVQMLIILLNFVVVGTGVLVARRLGARDEKSAAEIANVSIGINVIFGFVISMAIVFMAPLLLRLLNTPEQMMNEALVYLRIIGGTTLIQALIMTFSAIIRSHGLTKQTMYVTLGMNVLNVAGNYVFIFGLFGIPVLGVTGVAISTVIARTAGLIAMFAILKYKVRQPIRIPKLNHATLQHTKELLGIGVPSAGENLVYNLSQMTIISFVNLMGPNELTTRVYAMNIIFFVLVFSVSIGQSTQILISYRIGEGDTETAYKSALRSLRIGMLLSFLVGMVVLIFSRSLASIFTDNPDIVHTVGILLMFSVILEPGRCFNVILISSLRAAGDVKFPVIMAMLSMWGIAVALSYLLGIHFGMGLIGVWIGYMADEWTRGLLMLWRWRSRSWERYSLMTVPIKTVAEKQ